jgi:hypothetical protein
MGADGLTVVCHSGLTGKRNIVAILSNNILLELKSALIDNGPEWQVTVSAIKKRQRNPTDR